MAEGGGAGAAAASPARVLDLADGAGSSCPGYFSTSSSVCACPEHGRGLHQETREEISRHLYTNHVNAPSNAGVLPPVDDKMTSFTLYETKQRMFLVGSNHSNEWYRILKLERMGADPAELRVSEDSTIYTSDGIAAVRFRARTTEMAPGTRPCCSCCCFTPSSKLHRCIRVK